MCDGPPDAESDNREVCFVRSRRVFSLRRPHVVYEALIRHGDRNVLLARSKRVPVDSDAAREAWADLVWRLYREGWIPTQEPLVVGEDVLGVYVRRIRETD